ncbi:MAG: efflux RND transporter periplasmic adaptor subunit, partial [Bryobacteraceae bacterium]
RPPQVAFAKVERGQLVGTLASNGKVEPAEFVVVRAGREGVVVRLAIERGSVVRAGEVLVELDESEARTELAAAEARLEAARAALEAIRRGGPPVQLAEIRGALERVRLEAQQAERELRVLEKLLEKQAAAPAEVQAARDRLQRARAELKNLEQKRASLASDSDRTQAEARLREAQAARDVAARRLQQCKIRAPLAGVVYELRVRRGDYLRPGDEVAAVGRLNPARVRIYVDEPELGRLSHGMPVTITWDALPGRSWHGRIEQTPTQVTALGTRQVGEVLLTIENSDRDLLPGANVNAEIRTQVITGGLIIPREALRRNGGQAGVWVLLGDRLRWRPVRPGASTLTRVQVLEGLREGELVALGPGEGLRDGLRVRLQQP